MVPAVRDDFCDSLAAQVICDSDSQLGAEQKSLTVQQHPAATKLLQKQAKNPQFRPVLRARVTLANRRLRPLGHLTARES